MSAGTPLALRIENRAPGGHYRWAVSLQRRELPPLDPPLREQAAQVARGDSCDQLQRATEALAAVDLAEADVAKRAEAVRALLKTPPLGCEGLVEAANRQLNGTQETLGAWVLGEDEVLSVVVERIKDGKVERAWSRIYRSDVSGNWRPLYGFTFTGDDNDLYFTEPVPPPGKFEIRRQTDTGKLAFVPMLFYSWEPRKPNLGHFSIGGVAGLGFDTSNPVVAAGIGLTYQRNVSLVLGGAIRKFKRLAGQYDEAKIPIPVDASLTPEQLSRDTFGPTFFFGIAFRFGKSPFGEKESKK